MLASISLLVGIAAVSSVLLVPLVCRAAFRFGVFDQPCFRKIHVKPVPRLGGICVFASLLVAVLAVAGLHDLGVTDVPVVGCGGMLPLLLGCTVLFLVGLWDDLWHLSVGIKLIGQTVASLIPILWGICFEQLSILGGDHSIDLEHWAFPMTFLWILFVTNAWNLIDGLDGLSTGLAIIAAGTFTALFMLKNDMQPALILLALIGALAGFLWHNFHPARIFLGDSGSLLLGYILAVTAVMGSINEATAWPLAIPLLVLGLPILDTVLALARRLRESLRIIRRDRETFWLKRFRQCVRIFEADQQHIHYYLIARGFSHRGTVLTLYGVAVLLGALVFVI